MNKLILIVILIIYCGKVDCLYECNTSSQFFTKSLFGYKINNDIIPCIYSGFIELPNSKVFFVLIKSQLSKYTKVNKDEKIIIWLNEPGKSFIKSMLTETTYFRLNSNYEIDFEVDNIITMNSDFLFFDFPGDTGYSKGVNFKNFEEVKAGFINLIEEFNKTQLVDLSIQPIYFIGHSHLIPHLAKYTTKAKIDGIKVNKIALISSVLDNKYINNSKSDLTKGLGIVSLWDEAEYNYLKQKCEFELSNDISQQTCEELHSYIAKISGDINLSDVRTSNYIEIEVDKTLNKLLNNPENINSFNIDPSEFIKSNGQYWNNYNPEVEAILAFDLDIFNLNDFKDVPFHIYFLTGQYNLEQGFDENELNNFIPEFKNTAKGQWKIPIDIYKKDGLNYYSQEAYINKGIVKQTNKFTFILFKDAGRYIGKDDYQGYIYFISKNFLNEGSVIPCNNEVSFSDEGRDKTPVTKSTENQTKNQDLIAVNSQSIKLANSSGKGGCKSYKEDCTFLNNCNGNGTYDESTNGKCECLKDFYGPSCNLKVNALNKFTKLSISADDIRVFSPENSFDFIISDNLLFEIESNNAGGIISLIKKSDHYMIYDYTKHLYYQRIKDKIAFYVDINDVNDLLIVVTNPTQGDIEIVFNLCNFNTKSTEIFGPGGIGFILALLFFAIGFAAYVTTSILHRKVVLTDNYLNFDMQKDSNENTKNTLMLHVFGKEIKKSNN